MKKFFILLSILIFIICDQKFNEKLDNKRKGKPNYFICCRVKCRDGYTQIRPSCRCVCRNGYEYKMRCIKYSDLNKCDKGYYYSKRKDKCCSVKGRECRPIKKPNKPKKIDN